ncbi:MAG TPA: hypothetical protein VEF76_11840 [Patescibacteria group bacterium]|nr:hypothetical protein [Patescibacteria group bacterium]
MGDMKDDIAQVVETTVVETFSGMLGQTIVAAAGGESAAPTAKDFIYACLLLDQEQGASASFCFSFDDALLARTAAAFYPGPQGADKSVREDIACAVANIVGSKVKSCLNKYGNNYEMAVPFVGEPCCLPATRPDAIHLHFSCDAASAARGEDALVVDVALDAIPAGNC